MMKTKNTVIGALLPLIQSKWIQPAIVTAAIVVAFLGVTGCSHPH